MGKLSTLLLLGIVPWIFESCTVNPRIDKTKYWTCTTDSDCGGGCECFDGKICVQSDPDRADESCAPCQAPDADCDNDPSTGCEVDLDENSENCGACGVVCLDFQVCDQGKCVGCEDKDKDGFDVCEPGDPGDDGKQKDCDDDNPDINPDAKEDDSLCGNNIDEDCNGKDRPCDCKDEDDADSDSYYSAETCGGTDCDDNDPAINPGAQEMTCDGKDNDCNDLTPDAPDDDEDGFDVCGDGDEVNPDSLPADCDDSDGAINPGLEETTCDGRDNDCDESTPDAPDDDKDGFDVCGDGDEVNPDSLPADCDDTEDTINPDAAEICGNPADEDCSGYTDDIDNDNDGFMAATDGDPDGAHQCNPENSTPFDCDDEDASINPGALEICANNVDEDCSGHTNDLDHDGDGFIAVKDEEEHFCGGTDCNDEDALINPNAHEIYCDGSDQNCNPDDDNPDFDGDGYTYCGISGQDRDCDDTDPDVHPGENENSAQGIGDMEPCFDCKDNDCNGFVDCADEDCVRSLICTEMQCNDGDGDGWASCESAPDEYGCIDCDDSDGNINLGEEEICGNNVDENCDGVPDFIDHDGDGYPAGQDASGNLCNIPESDIDCDDGDYNVHPEAKERCDGQDDNCDRQVDNLDEDNDEHSPCLGQDCNDHDGGINVGATEDCFDYLDNDCDGLTDCADEDCESQCGTCVDEDGDGWAVCEGDEYPDDCDDSDPRVHPAQIHLCRDVNAPNDCADQVLPIDWLSGNASADYADGPQGSASFNGPTALALGYDIEENPLLYVADSNNDSIRKIDVGHHQVPDEFVTTIAGNPDLENDFVSQGTIDEVSLNSPAGLLWIPGQYGNGALVVADTGNNAIRIVNLDSDFPDFDPYYIMTISGNGQAGHHNGFLTQATFNHPTGMTLDEKGNLYIADTGNHCIRKISTDGWVSTFSGVCGENGDQQGNANVARYERPKDIEYIGYGRFLVTDSGNNKIRALNADGMMATLLGEAGSGNHDGYLQDAKIQNPTDMLIDWTDGVILFADMGNSLIRLMQQVEIPGIIDDVWTGTLAGGGDTEITPWDSWGTCNVKLSHPMGTAMYVDPIDNNIRAFYLSDHDKNMIYSILLYY